jgi:hypothetical protein
MAKPFHEMLPHQYADHLLKDIPWSVRFDRTITFNPEYSRLKQVSDELEGKTEKYRTYRRIHKEHLDWDKEVAAKKAEIRKEHAKYIYVAKQAGIKIHSRILLHYPDLEELALDGSPLPEISTGKTKKKNTKPEPVAENPEDNFRREFSREDKKDTW